MRKTNDIRSMSQVILDDFDKIAAALSIDCYYGENIIKMACPVHGGDNPGACVIYTTGETSVGNWTCFTHQCHSEYGIGIVDFVRGAIGHKFGREYTGRQTIRFIEDILSDKISNLTKVRSVQAPVKHKEYKPVQVPTGQIAKSIGIPSMYYIRRNYSKEILTKYHVGFCNNKGKPFYLRTVVPVFGDTDDYAVGFLARTINDKCSKCGYYHYNKHKCPETDIEKHYASKWINSKGFKKTSYLYNGWNAKYHINKSGSAILVEGPGDVWRLEECGIHNSVAMFGCMLSKTQARMLYKWGARELVIALDNDEAGLNGKKKIAKAYGPYFNLRFITTTENDIGDSSHSEIKRLLLV